MQARHAQIRGEQNPAALMDRRGPAHFEDIVSQYLPVLYKRAYRYVGDPHDAEDAVQDALLSAYKHLSQFKGGAKMTTWLTAIVTNSALTQLRRKPREHHVSLDEPLNEERDYCLSDILRDAKPSPESECIGSQLHGYLVQLVTELSPSLRKVIQLRHFEGLTTGETARLLGLSEGTVKAQVSRGRSKLKRFRWG